MFTFLLKNHKYLSASMCWDTEYLIVIFQLYTNSKTWAWCKYILFFMMQQLFKIPHLNDSIFEDIWAYSYNCLLYTSRCV